MAGSIPKGNFVFKIHTFLGLRQSYLFSHLPGLNWPEIGATAKAGLIALKGAIAILFRGGIAISAT